MFLAVVAAAALQLSPLVTQAAAEDAVVTIQGEKIHYVGELTSKGVNQVATLLEAHPGVRVLAINSVGGEIGKGIDLGQIVLRNGLDVHVTGSMCTSSCANYVFTAGRHKVIEPGAVVVWHGSAIQKGLFEFEKLDMSFFRDAYGRDMNWIERVAMRWKLWRYARLMKRRQAAFFDLIGVNPEVTVYGQLRGCECQWTFSPEDMARFGVDNVTAYPGYGMTNGSAVFSNWKLLKVQENGKTVKQ